MNLNLIYTDYDLDSIREDLNVYYAIENPDKNVEIGVTFYVIYDRDEIKYYWGPYEKPEYSLYGGRELEEVDSSDSYEIHEIEYQDDNNFYSEEEVCNLLGITNDEFVQFMHDNKNQVNKKIESILNDYYEEYPNYDTMPDDWN